jgi:benzoyl-CoA reductase/2-hydroxyglutaryl-CoA dehydratase subunit BcrC/BadD/HgdB
MQALRELIAHYAAARTARAGQPSAIVHVGRDVPREVVLAAGLVPVRLPGAPGRTGPGDHLFGAGIDDVARTQLNRILDGDLAGCAGLAIGSDCEGSVRLFLHLWEVQRVEPYPDVPPLAFVDCGHLPQASTRAYNRVRFDEFVDQVARWAGRPIRDDDLAAAVAAANGTRRLIRAIGELRTAADGPRLSGADALACIGAAFCLSPIDFAALVETLLDEAAAAPALPGVPVFLTGSGHDHPHAYELIESHGAVIVGEDHDWGALAGESDVDQHAPVREALVDAYWRGAPAAAGYGIAERAEQTARLAARAGARLVIAWLREHDAAPAWDLCGQREALARAGIPLLELAARPYGDGPDDCGGRLDEALCRVRP